VLLDDTLQLLDVCLELSVRFIHGFLHREAKLQPQPSKIKHRLELSRSCHGSFVLALNCFKRELPERDLLRVCKTRPQRHYVNAGTECA